jgi:hypothetical protein
MSSAPEKTAYLGVELDERLLHSAWMPHIKAITKWYTDDLERFIVHREYETELENLYNAVLDDVPHLQTWDKDQQYSEDLAYYHLIQIREARENLPAHDPRLEDDWEKREQRWMVLAYAVVSEQDYPDFNDREFENFRYRVGIGHLLGDTIDLRHPQKDILRLVNDTRRMVRGPHEDYSGLTTAWLSMLWNFPT